MEELAKLPKAYYKYANVELKEKDKEIDDKIVITVSLYVACKMEKYCYKESIPNQNLVKEMLYHSKILTIEELNIKDTYRKKFEFENINPEDIKNIKANKQINIYLSKYAKNKLYKELLNRGYELTFLIKKELVKADILTLEDLSY